MKVAPILAAALFFTAAGAAAADPAVSPPEYWPTHGWRESSPERQGIDSAKLSAVWGYVRDHQTPLHSLLLVRNGYVVLDAAFYPYDRSVPHDLASGTKSVTATLIGAAIERGRIHSVHDPLLPHFQERRILNRDSSKDSFTVEDLLIMRSGLACEADPGEPREMRASTDWVQFVLDQPLRYRPGAHYLYSSSSMHLLAATLRQAAGMSPLDFARTALFEPLGIEGAIWPADNSGVNHGWGDLYLFPRDMAKIGFLLLHGGVWDGGRILPADFVRAATRLQAKTDYSSDYGYGWWIFRGERRGDFEAVGRGGQRISVVPRLNLVAVMTGGGFDPTPVGELISQAVVSDCPLPENAGARAALRDLASTAEAAPAEEGEPVPFTVDQQSFGGTYMLSKNPFGLALITFDFQTPTRATLELSFADGRQRRHAIGFGRNPCFSPGENVALMVGVHGKWTTPAHLSLVYDEVASINCITFEADFSVRHVRFTAADRTYRNSHSEFEGQLTVSRPSPAN